MSHDDRAWRLRNLGARWRWQRSPEHGDSRGRNIAMAELPERDRACDNRVVRSITAESAGDRGNRLCGTAKSVDHRQQSTRPEIVLTR